MVGMADCVEHFERVGERSVALKAQRGAPDQHRAVVAIVSPGQFRQLALQALFFPALQIEQRVFVDQTFNQLRVQRVFHDGGVGPYRR